jgi:hypothetical protein
VLDPERPPAALLVGAAERFFAVRAFGVVLLLLLEPAEARRFVDFDVDRTVLVFDVVVFLPVLALFACRRVVGRRPVFSCFDSSSSPASFLAASTAAGTMAPRAAPAMIAFDVDTPWSLLTRVHLLFSLRR